MLYPTPILIGCACLPVALSLAVVIAPAVRAPLLAIDALLVAVALVDAWLGWRAVRRLTVELSGSATWSQGRPAQVMATIGWSGMRTVALMLFPDVPAGVVVADAPRRLVVPSRARAEVPFELTASERGTWTMTGMHVSLPSPLGLWRRHVRRGPELVVHVYPNLRRIDEYALLARTDRLALIGVRRSRRAGGDTEFERLRDYHSDDAMNRMDWRATARRDVLTVRDFRTSQAQRVVILLDSGRMLTTAAGPHARQLLDQAIDTALMLSWVAVRQGDRVGLVAYADGIRRWLPPRGGPRRVTELIHALHDLHAEPVESRHEEAFLQLERRERKRALVVVLTHVLDEVNAAHLERHARMLAGRHLPLIVLLRDPDLHAATGDPTRAAAANILINWRQGVIERMRRAGALVIDADADQLTAEVMSRYLEIKVRNLL